MPYNPEKAAQTIAYFAMREGGSINVLKVIKLVYLADRESLRLRGHPIQDEPRFSLPHGPVNSTTLDHLNGAYRENQPVWQTVLKDRADNKVGLANKGLTEAELDMLSKREISILSSVWDKLGHMDRFDLADWTHLPENVAEWQDPDGSRRAISLERMMAAVGLDHPIERAREHTSLKEAQNILASL
ncbi:MAG: Panacea domain-containing protein [Rhodobacterales bacterium]